MNSIRANLKKYILLLTSLLLYSTTSIFSKLASLSYGNRFNFILYYSILILVLGVYAIIWQQVLKCFDLSTAMLYKPLTIVFCCLWAVLLFRETLTLRMIVGIVIITLGMIYIGTEND